MKLLFNLIILCASLLSHLAAAQAIEMETLLAARGFSDQNFSDLEAIADRESERGNPDVWKVFKLLRLADIKDIPLIVRAMKQEVRINRPALKQLNVLEPLGSETKAFLIVPEDAKDWEYMAQVQSARARLLKAASKAVRGDSASYNELLEVGKRLRSNRLNTSISIAYMTMDNFQTRSEEFDPRQNDPEIAAAGFLAESFNARELQMRVARLAELRKPLPISPRDEFRDNMYTFAPFAVKSFGRKGYRLHELMCMIMLPDLAELPAILGMAVSQISDKQRAALMRIAESAQALANDAKTNPSALVMDIQRRRFQLAAEGAQAAKGDVAALAKLNDLGARAYDDPLGRRSFELFYLYRSEGDKVEEAATRNPNLRKAAAILETGVFSAADARENAAESEEYALQNSMAPGRESLAECFVRQSFERQKWEQRHCRPVSSGKDRDGLPIYKSDCGGDVFMAQPCRK